MKNNVTVSFKSYYVSKIIDYGRCFFKDETNSDIDGYSLKIHQQLGRINACEPDSGVEVGYWLLQDNRNTPDYHYLELITKNQSQDLRLLHYYYNHLYLINKPQLVLDTAYGKKETKATGLPNNINNVTDACNFLQDLLLTDEFKHINNTSIKCKKWFHQYFIYINKSSSNRITYLPWSAYNRCFFLIIITYCFLFIIIILLKVVVWTYSSIIITLIIII
jgi:hypothetical protein